MRPLGALLLVAAVASAQESLPAGAVARFGSAPFPVRDNSRPIAFAPDGRTIAAGGQVMSLATGRVVSPPDLVVIGFAPNGDWVTDRTRAVVAVDPTTGGPRFTLAKPADDAVASEFAIAGRTAAVAWGAYGVAVYDLAAGPTPPPRQVADGDASHVALSADGRFLAVDGHNTILLWDRIKGKVSFTPPDWEKGNRYYPRMAFSPDGRFLAVAAENFAVGVRLYHTDRAEERASFVPPVGRWVHVQFAADGETLVGVGSRAEIVRWSVRTGRETGRYPPPDTSVYSTTLSRDGQTAAADTFHGYLRVWDVESGTVAPVCDRHAPLRALAFPSPDTVATLAEDGSAFVWDLRTGRLLRRHHIPDVNEYSQVDWTRDGTRAAVVITSESAIGIVDGATGNVVCRIPVNDPTALAFRPDGSALIVSERDADDSLWDARTGARIRILSGRDHTHLAFAPDGRSYIAARENVSIREAATGAERVRLTPTDDLGEEVWSARFSADGRTIAVARAWGVTVSSVRDGRTILIDLWRARSCANAQSMALSPDGRWLATNPSSDGAIRVRDTTDPTHRPTFLGHTATIQAMAFTPDGRYLVSASADGTAVVWYVDRLRAYAPPNLLPPDDRRLAELWDGLASKDATASWQAMTELERYPARSVPFLTTKLRPIAASDREKFVRLIAALDANEYAIRERATTTLGQYAERAEPALVAALKAGPSAEVAMRIRALLRRIADAEPDPERLRGGRAVEVLERIATPEARALLATLATGDPAARLTREATASLQRWPK